VVAKARDVRPNRIQQSLLCQKSRPIPATRAPDQQFSSWEEFASCQSWHATPGIWQTRPMSAIKAVLDRALPGARVTERRDGIEIEPADGPKTRFRVVANPEDAGDKNGPTVLFLEHADPRSLATLRGQGSSYVTAQGAVFLTAPGLYVDIRPARALVDPDRTRNPFSTRGRQVCVSLLRFPERDWSVRDLAAVASASESFVSRVISALEDQAFLDVEGKQFRPRSEFLFAALAEQWPRPTAFFVGRTPSKGETIIGGGPAYEALDLVVQALPRAYVASRDQLRHLIVQTNSSPATSRMAQWEAVIQPLPLTNGLAPELICALELARDPRGREVLRGRQLVPWPIHV
jgi:hypothetical protein